MADSTPGKDGSATGFTTADEDTPLARRSERGSREGEHWPVGARRSNGRRSRAGAGYEDGDSPWRL
jgi:hypothetical protein